MIEPLTQRYPSTVSNRTPTNTADLISGSLGGRFEDYIRSQYESLCTNIANGCNSYDRLPKEMRENLVIFTAKVMESPRKYGHAEKGVEAFIKNLAENLSDRSKLGSINAECLSITYENMRPDTLAELFGRLGIKDIWKTIGEQATIKTFFETDDSNRCSKECKTALNDLMEDRNQIAHPSGNANWPSDTKVLQYINYLSELGIVISGIMANLAVTIPTRQANASAQSSPAASPAPILPLGTATASVTKTL